MRKLTSERRQFRPSLIVSEVLAPVSSLVPGVSATTAQTPEQQAEADVVYNNATVTLSADTAVPPDDASPFTAPVRSSSEENVAVSQSFRQRLQTSETSSNPTLTATLVRSLIQPLVGNLATITEPAILSTPGLSMRTPPPLQGTRPAQPVSSDANPIDMAQPVLNGTHASTQSSTLPSGPSPSSDSTRALAAAAGQRGAIRPLTLSPSSAQSILNHRQSVAAADFLTATASGTSSESGAGIGSGSAADSGSSGPPPNLPPVIWGSGGHDGATSQNGTGSFGDVVPVGSSMFFQVLPPSDPNYTISTISWGGGTAVTSYLPGDPAQPPPTLVQPQQTVATDYTNYVFIADNYVGTYTITCSVTYTNGASGTSQLTFTTADPTFSFSASSPGRMSTDFTADANGQRNGVFVGMQYSQTVDDRIKLTATTGKETKPQMVGSYMIMQLTEFNNSVVLADGTQNGAMHSQRSNQMVIDDGTGPSPGPLGQPLLSGDRSWQSNLNTAVTQTAFDSPFISVPGLFNKSVSYDASFQTYLMYQPAYGGDWVAVSEIDWNVQGGADNVQFPSNIVYGWQAGTFVQPNPTSASTPGNSFPGWNNDANSTDTWSPPL